MNTWHIFDLEQRQVELENALEGPAADATDLAHLWVPSEYTSIHYVDVPTAPRRKWMDIIPWMLEDKLLQDPSETHFSLIHETTEQLTYAVTSIDHLREWKRISENSSVEAVSMTPDYFALPFEENIVSVGWREGVILVRTSRKEGFASKATIAWPLIQKFLDENPNYRLSISIPDKNLIPLELRKIARVNESKIDWTFGSHEGVDLLPKELKRNLKSSLINQWSIAAGIIFIAIVISLSSVIISISSLENSIAVYQNKNVDVFRKIFNENIPASSVLRSKAETNLQRLFEQKEALDSPIIKSLRSLQPIMTNCECELVRMEISDSSVQISIRNADKLSKKSLKIDGFRVSLIPDKMTGDDNMVLSVTPSKG